MGIYSIALQFGFILVKIRIIQDIQNIQKVQNIQLLL